MIIIIKAATNYSDNYRVPGYLLNLFHGVSQFSLVQCTDLIIVIPMDH